ncbi:MAG: hypothetical protein HRU03_04275 [Nanoarchaeales archaeon]|nr:hypothetical protein [Nanoarchaeales archaeon]
MDKKKVRDSKNYKLVELKSPLSYFKKFWLYIWYDDSIGSYIANFAFAYVFIKFLLFPVLGLLLGTSFPIVAIVTGSMEHKVVQGSICNNKIIASGVTSLDEDEWWDHCGNYYVDNFNLTQDDFKNFEYSNGLDIGDVLILKGSEPENIEIGEVLIFIPQDRNFYLTKGPVIHRVVNKWKDEDGKFHFQTKGDHNSKSFENFENDIIEDNVLAVSAVRIPYLGYVKIVLTNVIFFVSGYGGI